MSYGTAAILAILTLVLLDVLIAQWAERTDGALCELLERGSILPITFLVIVVLGAMELATMLRAGGAAPNVKFALTMITLLMLAPWLSAAGWLGNGPAQVEGLYWQIVLLVVAVVGNGILLVRGRSPDGSLQNFGATLLMVFYLGFLGSFAVQLRCGRDIPNQDGAWLLLVAILVTKCGDIGAYFAGVTFGRRKLAPAISPGKTVEGAVGGLLGSASAAVMFVSASRIANWVGLNDPSFGPLYSLIEDMSLALGMSDNTNFGMTILLAVGIGTVLSVAGQLGDLVESCFKRDAGTKDSGKLIPRFGGILDLIDSPMLAVPVAWLLLTVL